MNIPKSWKSIFEAELLQEIQSTARLMTLLPDTVFIEIGQPIRTIPLMMEGTLKISREDENGKELLLYYVRANESCAMTFSCCMQVFYSEVRATAEDNVVLAAIPIEKMDSWMIKYPTWKSFIMNTIRNRFNELLRAIDQIAFQKLDVRLVTYLKEKSLATRSSLINLSHEQIATEMGSSREVISRLLKKLEEEKKILLYRKQIKLLNEL